MAFWKTLLGKKATATTPMAAKTRRGPDYLAEGIALEARGDYDGAITAFRMALRERNNLKDVGINLNIAVTYQRARRAEDALRVFRQVLEQDAQSAGAHYGAAFCYLQHGEFHHADRHLRAFLDLARGDTTLAPWFEYASEALEKVLEGAY